MLRRTASHSLDQSVAIQRSTTDCSNFAGPICRNMARYDGLLHIPGTNLSQFSVLRRFAAHSRDQSLVIVCATTDCCTFVGPICSNCQCYDGLVQTSRTNQSQFGAPLRITANQRDQSVAIQRATTDCCAFVGPISCTSARFDGLLHIRGTNL